MDKHLEVERSIIKKFRKEIWSKFTKAIRDYNLKSDGDKIMVCISGGKDSFLLAKCIQELLRHGKQNFTAEYVVMDPGYNKINRELIIANADNIKTKQHQKAIVDIFQCILIFITGLLSYIDIENYYNGIRNFLFCIKKVNTFLVNYQYLYSLLLKNILLNLYNLFR